jgi:hypothetical protein
MIRPVLWLKKWFTGSGKKSPDPVYHTPNKLVISKKPKRRTNYVGITDWCYAFNRRNGHIVPPVSTESIARKAMRKPRRTH